VAEPYALCAECHNTADFTGEGIHHPTLELYEGRPIVEEVEGTPSGHFATEGGPDCLTCHMPRLAVAEGDRASHALRAVLPDAPEALTSAVGCVSCHTDVTSPRSRP
jgi:formate-dependent nitrite reductase cytochrome c552 subunit